MTGKSIPHTWSKASLCDLGEWRGGGTPSKLVEAYWNGNIPWVSPKDMKQDFIFDSADHITKNAVDDSATKLIPPDSILCVTRSGILAHTFPVAITMVPVTVNQDIKAFTPSEGIHPRYLAWALRAEAREILETCSKDGTTVNSIESSRLYAYRVPVAPQREQLRIVAKIEELFSEVDNGIESLDRARQQLEVYRQALLRHAFEGKLTAKWREKNARSVKNAETLRKDILDTRRATWEKTQSKRYKIPVAPDATDLPPLPSAWGWVTLDELVSGEPRSLQSGPFGSSLKHSEFRREGLLVIGIDNVGTGQFSLGNQNRLPAAKFNKLRKYQARRGDLLITVMASLGRTCVVPRSLETAIITKHVYRVSMDERYVLSEFYNLALQGPTVSRKQMLQGAQGQTRPGLNSSILREIPLPLCSLAEQQEIVARLSQRLSELENLDGAIQDELKRAEALRQSILKTAFLGRLVAQDRNDEPASVLLERIRNEKAERER